jgi:hypothetical protein
MGLSIREMRGGTDSKDRSSPEEVVSDTVQSVAVAGHSCVIRLDVLFAHSLCVWLRVCTSVLCCCVTFRNCRTLRFVPLHVLHLCPKQPHTDHAFELSPPIIASNSSLLGASCFSICPMIFSNCSFCSPVAVKLGNAPAIFPSPSLSASSLLIHGP